MASCPWCKAPVQDPLAPCPRCGRRSDEAAIPGMVDVPDLDIPAPRHSKGAIRAVPVPAAPPAPTVAERTATPPANAFVDHGNRSFEDDDDDLAGSSRLDLDLSKGPPLIMGEAPPAAASAAAKPPPATGAAPAPDARAAASPARPVEPKPAPKPAAPAADPFEAKALADYGDPPEQWWRTPKYAYRVLRRRKELKKVAAQKAREAERAQGAAEDALLAFAEVVRTIAEPLAAYGRAFAEVRAAEDVQRERDAVLAAETDTHKQKQAEADARIAELEAQLTQIQMEERGIAAELGEAETLLKRAEARVKRVEIEIRNAVQQSGGEAPGDAKAP